MEDQLKNLERKLKDLKIRHGLGEIDRETYDLTFSHLSEQMAAISKEIASTLTPKISSLDKLISNALKKLDNLHEVWHLNNLETKRRVQKRLFPDGVLYDVKNHQYLTKKQIHFFL